ncbi:MAG: imidazoleglycerol-phosphate dehydratase HisB [Lachnospiraceae bacterium]
MSQRKAAIERNTAETRIALRLNIDGNGTAEVKTGIGFLDHMLTNFARHGFFDIVADVTGDLEVDTHHTVEDLGIVLGQAVKEAIGDKAGIKRYGSFILPMDETLMLCSLDLCGRPYLNFDVDFTVERVGEFETEMVREFFYAVSYSAGMNLHIKQLSGGNNHHMIEAIFKAFAKALDIATMTEERCTGVLSTKGSL